MNKFAFFLCIFFSTFLISCVTTNVYEKNEITLIQDDAVLSVENTLVKDGKIKNREVVNNTIDDSADDGNVLVVKTDEKVTVESKVNGELVAYTFLGKPFVIIGCSSYELLKCCGYAFVNFLGGYSTMDGGETFWMMPDVKKSLAKSKEYSEQNKVKVYPEYHKPFTNNKITVSKITYEAQTISTDENEMLVKSKEEYVYDNTLSVQRSVSADMYATFGIVGAIGSVITVPVSVGTWILGALYRLSS